MIGGHRSGIQEMGALLRAQLSKPLIQKVQEGGLISGWSWDRADYFAILKGDKVTEYGSGEVREKNVGGIRTIFIHQF